MLDHISAGEELFRVTATNFDNVHLEIWRAEKDWENVIFICVTIAAAHNRTVYYNFVGGALLYMRRC